MNQLYYGDVFYLYGLTFDTNNIIKHGWVIEKSDSLALYTMTPDKKSNIQPTPFTVIHSMTGSKILSHLNKPVILNKRKVDTYLGKSNGLFVHCQKPDYKWEITNNWYPFDKPNTDIITIIDNSTMTMESIYPTHLEYAKSLIALQNASKSILGINLDNPDKIIPIKTDQSTPIYFIIIPVSSYRNADNFNTPEILNGHITPPKKKTLSNIQITNPDYQMIESYLYAPRHNTVTDKLYLWIIIIITIVIGLIIYVTRPHL
jgi:hypothetical protein